MVVYWWHTGDASSNIVNYMSMWQVRTAASAQMAPHKEGDYVNSPRPSISKHGLSPFSSPSPSLRFSLSTSYSEATAPKARRQLFNLSIAPVATTSSTTSTPSQPTGLSSSSEPSCTTQDVNLARRNHTHQHSYNTRFQPNRISATHTPESSFEYRVAFSVSVSCAWRTIKKAAPSPPQPSWVQRPFRNPPWSS